jgi:transcriptional regulator with XRE-family HTH domain
VARAQTPVVPISEPAKALHALRAHKSYGSSRSNPFRELRKAFGLTQHQASYHTGVPRSLWLAWERRERPISVDQLKRVREAFGLERPEIRWVLDWWKEARAATLTIPQLNALANEVGADMVDPVEMLFRLWDGS